MKTKGIHCFILISYSQAPHSRRLFKLYFLSFSLSLSLCISPTSSRLFALLSSKTKLDGGHAMPCSLIWHSLRQRAAEWTIFKWHPHDCGMFTPFHCLLMKFINVIVNLWGSSPPSSLQCGRHLWMVQKGAQPQFYASPSREAGMPLLGNNPKTTATVNKKTLHG